ncbi:hypothetical protein KSF73_14120 [Burkholderiaceae bacterium DAT-1]|nr:hypothetical protein [Burkholderiaceae bacterium DAT-1]
MQKFHFRLFILALPLLFIPVINYWLTAEAVKGFVPQVGQVVGHVVLKTRKNSTVYKSVIQYAGSDGQPFQIVDPLMRGIPDDIGDEVSILVDPENQAHAVRGGIGGHWFGFTVTTIISLFFFILALSGTYLINRPFFRKRAKRPPRVSRKIAHH